MVTGSFGHSGSALRAKMRLRRCWESLRYTERAFLLDTDILAGTTRSFTETTCSILNLVIRGRSM